MEEVKSVTERGCVPAVCCHLCGRLILAGSLVSNCVAGLSHGAGFVPGANVGENGAIFEQGTRHVGADIAGRDEVNPTGECSLAVA